MKNSKFLTCVITVLCLLCSIFILACNDTPDKQPESFKVDYEVLLGETVYDEAYIIDNNDGSFTIGADAFSGKTQFIQTFSGDFKANTTYAITLEILDLTGSINWGLRFATEVDGYGYGNAIYQGKETVTVEYTVGGIVLNQISLYSLTRFTIAGQDSVSEDAWSITLKATVEEVGKVPPYRLVAGDTVYDDMYITNNGDGSFTIGADAFSGRSQFKQVFNGVFKANTTYVITLVGYDFTGDYAYALRIYSDANRYTTSNTLMDDSNYNPRIIEITIGEEDVGSIVFYSTTRYQNGQSDSTGDTPWSITLSATVEEKVAE